MAHIIRTRCCRPAFRARFIEEKVNPPFKVMHTIANICHKSMKQESRVSLPPCPQFIQIVLVPPKCHPTLSGNGNLYRGSPVTQSNLRVHSDCKSLLKSHSLPALFPYHWNHMHTWPEVRIAWFLLEPLNLQSNRFLSYPHYCSALQRIWCRFISELSTSVMQPLSILRTLVQR